VAVESAGGSSPDWLKAASNLPKWTAADDREAECKAWLEEDAPDNWKPFESLWAANPRQLTSLGL